MRWRAELTARTLAVLAGVDVLVTAGSLTAAPSLDPDEPPTFLGAKVPSITGPFNTTGLPTLATPTGYDAAGLPSACRSPGARSTRRPFSPLGHAFEIATAGLRRRPDLSGQASRELAAA